MLNYELTANLLLRSPERVHFYRNKNEPKNACPLTGRLRRFSARGLGKWAPIQLGLRPQTVIGTDPFSKPVLDCVKGR